LNPLRFGHESEAGISAGAVARGKFDGFLRSAVTRSPS
jgi:hypothetical protein